MNTGANTWTCNVKDTQISSQDVTTDDKGTATGSFTPPKGGTYQVKVTGTDAAGHSVTDNLSKIHGTHTFKAGIYFEHTQKIQSASPLTIPIWASASCPASGSLSRYLK